MIVLDTHLLLLFVVGALNRGYIAKHKRLHPAYRVDDFTILTKVLADSTKVVVTPNTLTEVSNLAAQINEPARTQIRFALRAFVSEAAVEERYVASELACRHHAFSRLGLTNSVMLNLRQRGSRLITADLQLYLAVLKDGFDAVNFTYLRELEQ